MLSPFFGATHTEDPKLNPFLNFLGVRHTKDPKVSLFFGFNDREDPKLSPFFRIRYTGDPKLSPFFKLIGIQSCMIPFLQGMQVSSEQAITIETQ